MEIRLSHAITANPIQFTANVEMPKQTNDAPQSAPAMEAIPEPIPVNEPEPVVETPHVPEPEPVSETPHVPEPVVEPSPAAAEAVADTTDSDPNRQLSADEIAALFASANASATEPESEPAEKVITEPVTEVPHVPEPEPVVEPSPAAEEAVADTTDSDPNRQLSADEIAALFASANAGATEPESKPAEEVITEPVTDAPQAPEPVSEPEPAKSPVVDLNNTNRNLTPDEIAALFSSM